MAAPSPRLARKIRQAFSPDQADDVIRRLSTLPETSQSAERIKTAVIIRAEGNLERFATETELVQLDWRDTLMGTGLEHSDFEKVRDDLLGPTQ